MQKRLIVLNQQRMVRGDPPLRMGIGLHVGEVVAGCMGSEELMSYTCIGATVNLASRLCSSAAEGQILITKAVLEKAGDRVRINPLESIRVKGFDHPIDVFEVTDVLI